MTLKPFKLSLIITFDKDLSTRPKARAVPQSIGKNTKLELLKDSGRWHVCWAAKLSHSVNPQSLQSN